ncbi:MAG: hypothetical protein B9S34_02575 [Opitutia bacterium Tous-C1TDCM]|nr:MAG: hypothetical protein B9S34_02575 [Opitutae bacterium Tous-C1TDCM]
MVRRLFLLILACACALAPVHAAWTIAADAAESCCCPSKCPCTPTDCAPAPASRTASPTPLAPAAVPSAGVRQLARPARPAFSVFVSSAPSDRAALSRAPEFRTPAPAATSALFRAHCSWLI